MKLVESKKNSKKFLAKLTIKLMTLIFVFYAIVLLLNQYSKINAKQKHLNLIDSELKIQQAKNAELKKFSEATESESKEYFIKVARKLNLSKSNEKIFVNISGN